MNLVLCIWLAYECEQVGHGLFSKFRCGSLPIKYWSWTRFSAANSAVCEIDSSKRRTTMGDLIYSSRGLFSACVFERRQRDRLDMPCASFKAIRTLCALAGLPRKSESVTNTYCA